MQRFFKWILVFCFLVFFVLALIFRKFFLTLILLLISGALQYFTHAREVRFEAGHVFFFSILIGRIDGFVVSMLFIVFAGLLPVLIAGDIDELSFIEYPVNILTAGVSLLFASFNIVIMGLIFCFLNYALIILLSEAIDVPGLEILEDAVIPFVANIVYFISFSGPVLTFFLKFIHP
jgi:hypothetical protein